MSNNQNQAATGIPTWQERAYAELGDHWRGYKPDSFMQAEIDDLRAQLAREREKRQTAQGMADCMDMVRQELIEAGVIDKGAAPMFIANAVVAQLARRGQGEVRYQVQQDFASMWCDVSKAEFERCSAEKRIVYLAATPQLSEAQADLSDGARAKIGSIMPCGARVTNVYEAYAAGKRAATPPEQQARAVPDILRIRDEEGRVYQTIANLTDQAAVHFAHALAAAPSPTAQPVAPAAPTYWNSQQKMISRAIIGLRDGWATRKDADDALAALEVAASVSPQGAQVGGQWISVEDERKPEARKPVLLFVRTLTRGYDDEGRPHETEGAEVAMGEYRHGASSQMSYFDCYTSPMSDNDWITHWMPLPATPGKQPHSTATEGADKQKGDAE